MWLAALRLSPTREILPKTLQEGEEQTQSGDLAEGNDDCFRLIGRERVTLRQLLARKIAKGTGIDTMAGIEYTEWVEMETFPEGIAPFAGHKEEGAKEAKRHTNGLGEISFWTDDSRLDSRCVGVSIA